jgi:signal transduction histidine kinase
VKRHSGEIHVESAPGAGAAFHIDLPVSGTVAPGQTSGAW